MPSWVRSSLQQAAWAPLLVWFSCVVAAWRFNAYALHPWLDIPTHFLGGIAMTYFFAVSIFHSQRVYRPIPYPVQLLLAIGLTAIVAIGWEIAEYLSDRLFATHTNHGVADTLSDLAVGLCGSLVMALVRARK